MTKYLLIAALIAVVYFLWRSPRVRERRAAPPPARNLQDPQDMVSCPVCAVHLPRSEALPGPDGQLYCCPDHRVAGNR